MLPVGPTLISLDLFLNNTHRIDVQEILEDVFDDDIEWFTVLLYFICHYYTVLCGKV